MRKSPIKIKLSGERISGTDNYQYRVTQISGAITLGGYNGEIFRIGDQMDEKQAIALTRSYVVTITQ
jgi:hypothetical protein